EVLEVFDKRWTIVTELRKAIGAILSANNASPQEQGAYESARQRAAFLFGSDVAEYLKSIHSAIGRLVSAEQQFYANPNDQQAIDQRYRAIAEISPFFDRTNELMMPYMRMHQKAPPPMTWRAVWRWMRSPG